MNTYDVYIWKTVCLEVKIEAHNAEDAAEIAMENFDDGDYDDKWDEAETTSVQALCEESYKSSLNDEKESKNESIPD